MIKQCIFPMENMSSNIRQKSKGHHKISAASFTFFQTHILGRELAQFNGDTLCPVSNMHGKCVNKCQALPFLCKAYLKSMTVKIRTAVHNVTMANSH